ncbi:MAG TPA: GNAT family N-acetyltransferase [Trebonia sp.]|nr:GNAT family N-acetyltransferase [Trebonia sp.]
MISDVGLRLRPLRTGDEAVVREAQEVMAGEGFPFAFGLDETMEWNEFLRNVDKERRGVDLPDGRVPATFLVADVGGMIVGRISIRHALNDLLARQGGHIGYCVLPPYRRHGYATEMLRQALVIIRSLGVDRVLVTCDDDNLGSVTVIETCDGKLDSRVVASDGVLVRRYWID